MSDQKLKEKLHNAVARNVPDALDNILEQCDTKKGEARMTEKKRMKPIYKVATTIAAMLVLVVSIVGAIHFTGLTEVETVIAFDVNPSIEIELNSRGQVIEVKALNEDAKIVIGDMKFRNVDLEVAVNAIIGSMLKNGYLSTDQNSILVSVRSCNPERAEELKENISTDITAILNGSNIEAAVIVQEFEKDEELDKIAEKNCISHSKAKLISRIIVAGLTDADGFEYTYERLASLTVNELRVLLETKKVELDDVQSSGTASETTYLGKGKALQIVYADAAVVVENVVNVDIDMDYEDGLMVYEIAFYVDGTEYEYVIDAITGEIIKFKVDVETPDTEEDTAEDITESEEETTPEEGKEPEDDKEPEEGRKPEGEKNPIGGNIHDNPSNIGRGNAKKIAMDHMGCTRDELRDLECDFAVKDGRNVYIVEFEVDGVEYTYFIDVHSGEILHTESEAEDDDDDEDEDDDEDDDDEDDDDEDDDENKKPHGNENHNGNEHHNGNEKGNGNKNR